MAMQPGNFGSATESSDGGVGPSGTQVITSHQRFRSRGKNNVVANTAIALAKPAKSPWCSMRTSDWQRRHPARADTPKYTLEHVLAKTCRLEDITLTGPSGITVNLPASTGISQLTVLTEAQQLILGRVGTVGLDDGCAR